MVKAEILYEDDEKIRILLKETDRARDNFRFHENQHALQGSAAKACCQAGMQ